MIKMVICDYCALPAELVSGHSVYPHRPDLAGKQFWRCLPCAAHVGCHPGTATPLGGLANQELRRARMEAHAAFDPLWRGIPGERSKQYEWLASGLGIDASACHIGMMNERQCYRVVALCNPGKPTHTMGEWITGKQYRQWAHDCEVPPWEVCSCPM
jgi:hypothetical protein